MRKSTLAVLAFFCGAASLAIAVYQLMDSRPLEAALSIVFCIVFLAAGVANRRQRN